MPNHHVETFRDCETSFRKRMYIYPSIHLSIYPSIYLSIHPSIHLSIYPSIHLSIYLSVCLSVCLSIQSNLICSNSNANSNSNSIRSNSIQPLLFPCHLIFSYLILSIHSVSISYSSSIHVSIHLSIYPSRYLYLCLFVPSLYIHMHIIFDNSGWIDGWLAG